jgi:hypothetical protein
MRTLTLSLIGLSVVALSAPARAQQPAPPVPPRPAAVQQPALLQPPKAPPPQGVAPSRTPAIQRAPVFAPVRLAAKTGLPPDSVKPAALRANASLPPAQARFVGRATPPATPPGASAAALQRSSVMAAPATAANPPAGATMQCRDGTWLTGAPSASRCSANGGVATILAQPRATPAPAAKQRRP